MGEHGERQRGRQHQQYDADQRLAPIDPLGQSADHRPEQRQRQHAQQRHQRDIERRTGVLIDEHPNCQHFQPAHRGYDEADQP